MSPRVFLFSLLLATNVWAADGFMSAGSLASARIHHTATRLEDGRVLVAGGTILNDAASAEIYDPGSRTWTVTGGLVTPRGDHTATLLKTGRCSSVLVVGGVNGTPGPPNYLASAEVYGPLPPVPPAAAVTVGIEEKKTVRTTAATYQIRGTASVNAKMVEIAQGKGRKFKKVRGVTKWSYRVHLKSGSNPILIRAATADGRISTLAKIKIIRR